MTWALLAGILVALIGVVPGVLAYRSSKRADARAAEATQRAAAVEERKADREDFETLTRELRADLERIRDEAAADRAEKNRAIGRARESDEARRDAVRLRVIAERDAQESRAKIVDLTSRVEHLESELRAARAEISRLTAAPPTP